jgi:hypothetical protein
MGFEDGGQGGNPLVAGGLHLLHRSDGLGEAANRGARRTLIGGERVSGAPEPDEKKDGR